MIPQMLVLIAFALVAGAGTAISPCVIPVLPALLAAGATGGRRRPFGIVLGLVVTYVVTIVALASVIDGVGLADGITRTLAIVALIGFGAILALPKLADGMEARLSRISRLGPRSGGDGFRSGLLVGGALGFAYAPCAGPILGAVISVSATQGASANLVAVAVAFGIGTGLMMLALSLGGRRAVDRVRSAGRGPVIQRTMALVLVATGIAMAANLDVRFQTALANHFPAGLVNPTKPIEESAAVRDGLSDLRGKAKFDSARANPTRGVSGRAPEASTLPILGTAPDFTGNQRWFNTPGGRALSLAGLKGHVVLVDFWTYTCINCLRTLPALRALDARYRRDGLTIVGVHTPEFTFERDAGNVADAIRRNHLRYPVAQDNAYATWNAWGNQYWPAKYLIDAKGRVRYTHFGEGNYGTTESAVRALLAEAGTLDRGRPVGAHGIPVGTAQATPETYLGTKRAERFLPSPQTDGVRTYPGYGGRLPESHFALKGTWKLDGESAIAGGRATLNATVTAQKVYLVLSSAGGRPRQVQVLLDGRPVGARSAGADARGGAVTVRRQRLYNLVSLPRSGTHSLELRFAPGVSGFAFTFG